MRTALNQKESDCDGCDVYRPFLSLTHKDSSVYGSQLHQPHIIFGKGYIPAAAAATSSYSSRVKIQHLQNNRNKLHTERKTNGLIFNSFPALSWSNSRALIFHHWPRVPTIPTHMNINSAERIDSDEPFADTSQRFDPFGNMNLPFILPSSLGWVTTSTCVRSTPTSSQTNITPVPTITPSK